MDQRAVPDLIYADPKLVALRWRKVSDKKDLSSLAGMPFAGWM